MVFRPGSADEGSLMATASPNRLSVTGRWHLAPICPALMGLASAQSICQKLEETVCATLSNANAPSTRANFALRRKIFSD